MSTTIQKLDISLGFCDHKFILPHNFCFHIQEQIKIEQNDIKQQREQLYRKMELLTSQGLLISPNIALPVTGQIDDSSKETSEENSPQSDSSTSNSNSLSGSTYSTSTVERRKDSKWNRGRYKNIFCGKHNTQKAVKF